LPSKLQCGILNTKVSASRYVPSGKIDKQAQLLLGAGTLACKGVGKVCPCARHEGACTVDV